MKEVKNNFSEMRNKIYDRLYYSSTGMYFSYLKKEVNSTLDKYKIKNPIARALLSVPVGLYFDGKETIERTIELIDVIGEKLFEYPEYYYEKKNKRESTNEW